VLRSRETRFGLLEAVGEHPATARFLDRIDGSVVNGGIIRHVDELQRLTNGKPSLSLARSVLVG
jgi:hypothetical protein